MKWQGSFGKTCLSFNEATYVNLLIKGEIREMGAISTTGADKQ